MQYLNGESSSSSSSDNIKGIREHPYCVLNRKSQIFSSKLLYIHYLAVVLLYCILNTFPDLFYFFGFRCQLHVSTWIIFGLVIIFEVIIFQVLERP